MKSQIVTQAIILSRRNFGEADRILTVITPDHGKISLIAKGVRRPKSKLAGGIELCTINDITLLPSRTDLKRLISSRIAVNYGNIVKDIHKTMLYYELLKRLDRYMEHEAGPEYFEIIKQTLVGLNDEGLSIELIEVWFTVQLLKISGHAPNLSTDSEGSPLAIDEVYMFDYESTSFRLHSSGSFNANHIKLLRLAHATESPLVLKQVRGAHEYAPEVQLLARAILQQHISIS